MKEQKEQMKKVCGFHVNEWHLTTMILPYIHKEIENNNEVITILQNGIKSNIEEILAKMNLNKELNKKIKEIDWTKTHPIKYNKIKSKLENVKGQANKINILINGDKEFIEIVNKNIEKAVKNMNIESKITIINCYDVTQFTNISEITDKHEFIINTSGIKRTNEVFNISNEKNA